MSIVFTAGKYLTWGVVSVSVTNLLIVVIMLVVFVLALLLPFPRDHAPEARPGPPPRGDDTP
jgi:hypothetical protein